MACQAGQLPGMSSEAPRVLGEGLPGEAGFRLWVVEADYIPKVQSEGRSLGLHTEMQSGRTLSPFSVLVLEHTMPMCRRENELRKLTCPGSCGWF